MTMTKDDIKPWRFDTDGEQVDCKPYVETCKIADELELIKKSIIDAHNKNNNGYATSLLWIESMQKALRGNGK